MMQIRAHVSKKKYTGLMEWSLDWMLWWSMVMYKYIFSSLRHNKNGKNAANIVVTVYKQQKGGALVRWDVRSHLISARQPAGALCAMHCYEWKGPRHGGKVDFDRSPVEFINLENDNIGKQRLRLPFLKTTISSRNKDPSLFIDS